MPKETFINAYFAARQNVTSAKKMFGENLTLFLVVKDYIQDTETVYDDIEDIDEYLVKIYNREELERLLK